MTPSQNIVRPVRPAVNPLHTIAVLFRVAGVLISLVGLVALFYALAWSPGAPTPRQSTATTSCLPWCDR